MDLLFRRGGDALWTRDDLDDGRQPEARLGTAAVLGSALVGALSVLLALALSPSLPQFEDAVPAILALMTGTGAAATYFLAARAAAIHDPCLRVMAWGYGLATGAVALYFAGFSAARGAPSLLGTTPGGLHGLYLAWHLVLAGAVFVAIRRDRMARRWWEAAVGTGIALLLIAVATGTLPLTALVDSAVRFTPLSLSATAVTAVITGAAAILWLRATAPRPSWTEAWVIASLLLATADLIVALFAQARFGTAWWASQLLRLAVFAVPGIGIVVGFHRLYRQLDGYTEALRQESAGRREAIDELRQSHRELELVNQRLDAFAGTVAHDLRAPLTAVGGFVDLALDRTEDETTRGMLTRAQSASQRMTDLIVDLLSYARARDAVLEPAPLDLEALVADIVADDPRLSDAVDVGPLPVVHADQLGTRQVLSNLLTNAVKYVAPDREPAVHVTGHADGHGWCRITVEDNGIGIPEQLRDNIFEPFHRLHQSRQTQGTGLGLAICREIVVRHGGALGVEPAETGGSRFWFVLPAAG